MKSWIFFYKKNLSFLTFYIFSTTEIKNTLKPSIKLAFIHT